MVYALIAKPVKRKCIWSVKMAISEAEKGRRSGKKMHEKVDNLLLEMMEDEEFTSDVFKEWAKADPKGFFTIMKDRLPKVQPVDQDLQKTLISLKSMMEGLPEVEDLHKLYKKAQGDKNKLQYELDRAQSEIKMLQKKIKSLAK